mgnify:FL=1
MEALLRKFEKVNGQWVKIQSEKVTFVCVTGSKSAKIIDKNGKQHTVRRSSLTGLPPHILWPEVQHTGKCAKPDTESWKRACYFD